MARLPRLVVPGQVHHLLQRGHGAQAVFVDDEDRRQYLQALHEALRAQAVQLHAYALREAEVHHGRRGTLWDGRFRAGVVQQGTPVLHSLLLIDGLRERPGAAPAWTSAAQRLGRGREALVTDPPEYWLLGNTPFEREAAYAALLDRGLPPAEAARIEHAAANGWALGDAAFQLQMAEQAGRPVRPRPRGRPRRTAPA